MQQLAWQASEAQFVTLDSYATRLNTSLKHVIRSDYAFVQEHLHEYRAGNRERNYHPSLKMDRELFYDKLVFQSEPYTMPNRAANPPPPTLFHSTDTDEFAEHRCPPRFLNRKGKVSFDWTQGIRLKNPVERLRLLYSPLDWSLREPVCPAASQHGPEVHPDCLALVTPELGGFGLSDSRPEIMGRLFKTGISKQNLDPDISDTLTSTEGPQAPVSRLTNQNGPGDVTEAPRSGTEHLATTSSPYGGQKEEEQNNVEPCLSKFVDVLQTLSTLKSDVDFLSGAFKNVDAAQDDVEKAISRFGKRQKPLSQILLPARLKPPTEKNGKFYPHLLPEGEPVVFVAIADGLGGRVERLRFGADINDSQQHMRKVETATVEVQVNYEDIALAMGLNDGPANVRQSAPAARQSCKALTLTGQPTARAHTIGKAAVNTPLRTRNVESAFESSYIVKPDSISSAEPSECDDDLRTRYQPARLGAPEPWPDNTQDVSLDIGASAHPRETKSKPEETIEPWRNTRRKHPQLVLPRLGHSTSTEAPTSFSDSPRRPPAVVPPRNQKVSWHIAERGEKDVREASLKQMTRGAWALRNRAVFARDGVEAPPSGLAACRGGRRVAEVIRHRIRRFGELCPPERQQRVLEAQEVYARSSGLLAGAEARLTCRTVCRMNTFRYRSLAYPHNDLEYEKDNVYRNKNYFSHFGYKRACRGRKTFLTH